MDPAAYIRRSMRPLRTIPTGMAPSLPAMPEISTVVFDIYGTLMISAAGEIGTVASECEQADDARLEPLTEEFGVSPGYLDELFRHTVKRHQAERQLHGVEFPEVEIREVWAEMFEILGLTPESASSLEEVALRYECGKNPVWRMPGARRAIEAIHQSGRKLGIVSNAQFYTVPVLEGLFGAQVAELGFDPALSIFSYEVREGKPSRRLYEILAERAAQQGIAPRDIFYLGNDMIKDVLPARELGFRTGLFAGDARSLRLGGLSPAEASTTADAVITDLAQLPGLFHTPA